MPIHVGLRRQTRLRALGDRLVAPLARVGLAGKRTHVLTVPGGTTRRPYSTPVQLVLGTERGGSSRRTPYFATSSDAPLEAFAAEAAEHSVFRVL